MSTACTAASRRIDVAPRASVLIESMREIGYSLPTAMADIVDNSLAAGAQRIDLLADTELRQPFGSDTGRWRRHDARSADRGDAPRKP